MSISKRLLHIAKYIDGYDSLADIACDHGYLGIYALENYNINDVLLTDINELPLQCAMENAKRKKIDNKITFKLGDGLRPLDKDYEVISIAGIGGILMIKILEDCIGRAQNAKRLILCPNTDSYAVRKFLDENGFEIELEEIVHDFKYYEIIVAKYNGLCNKYNQKELKYGPILLKNKCIEFVDYYTNKCNMFKEQLNKINDMCSKAKIINEIKEIESII